MACLNGMPENNADRTSDTVEVWEPSLLRQRLTEEVVSDWLASSSLQLEPEGETTPHGKLPSINRQGNADGRASPQQLGRGYGSPGPNRIPTRLRTAQVESTLRLRGTLDTKKPMTSPVTSENMPPKSLGAWGSSKDNGLLQQHRRTVSTPLIPVDTKPDMSNVEFTGSSFVTTEFPSRRPVDRIETMQLNALLDRMVEDVQEKAKSISQSEVMEQLRHVHDAVSKEVARQVSVHCLDQGMLVERCLQFYTKQVEQLPELFIKPLEAKMAKLRAKYQDTKTELDDWRCKHQDLDKRYKKTRESEANERMLKQKAEGRVIDLENEVQLMSEKIASLQKSLEKTKENYKRERDQREALEAKLLNMQQKCERIQQAHDKLVAHYDLLKTEKDEKMRALGEALDARQTAMALLDCEKVARRRLDEEVKDLNEFTAQLEAKLKNGEIELREAKNAQVQAELAYDKMKRELQEALDRLSKIKDEHERLVKEHKDISDKLRETSEALKHASADNSRLKAELEAERSANDELTIQLKAKSALLKEREAELSRTSKELAAKSKAMGTADEDITNLKKKVNRLAMECADIQAHWLIEIDRRIELERRMQGYEERIERASKEKEQQIDFLNIKIKMMAKEIEQLDEKLQLSNQQLQVADERLAALEKEMEAADKRIAEFDLETAGYRDKILSLEDTVKQQQQRNQQLEEENNELQGTVSTLEARIQQAAQHLENMRHKYNAEHFMRVALETRYKALQVHLDELTEEAELSKRDMANLERRLEQQIRELQEEVVGEQTNVSNLEQQQEEAQRAWIEQRQTANHEHETAMIQLSQQAAADKQTMKETMETNFQQVQEGLEHAWETEKFQLQKIIEELRFRPAKAALGTQMTPPPTPPSYGDLSTQMTPMPTPTPTPLPTPPSTSHSSAKPTSVLNSSTQWSKPPTPQLPPQMPKPLTPAAAADVTSRSTQVSRTVTPQVEQQPQQDAPVPLQLDAELSRPHSTQSVQQTDTDEDQDELVQPEVPPEEDASADLIEEPVGMEHPAWNSSDPTIDARPVSVWTDEAARSGVLECTPPAPTAEESGRSAAATPPAELLSRGQTPAEILSRGQTPAEVLSRGQTPAEMLSREQTPAEMLSRGQTPAEMHSRGQTPGTPPVGSRPTGCPSCPSCAHILKCPSCDPLPPRLERGNTAVSNQRGITPNSSRGVHTQVTPVVSRGVTPAAKVQVTPVSTAGSVPNSAPSMQPFSRGVTPDQPHRSLSAEGQAIIPAVDEIEADPRPTSIGARPPSTWTDGLMDTTSYIREDDAQVPVVTSWDASDAIDYAADGLRVVAQAIHETCDSKADSQNTLNQCLATVVKACTEIRNAQRRLKTPGSSRGVTPVGKVNRPQSARVIALGEECPLCRMLQSDGNCSVQAPASREITVSGSRNNSVSLVEIKAPAPVVPVKPPQRYNKEESTAFASWLASQGMPSMHPLQQEGLMHILHSVQEQLMDGIETLEGEITEVVSRYIPEEAVNIAKVTGGEVKGELQKFKDRVRQTMSFECCNFLRSEKKADTKVSKDFGQVAFLKCDCDHNMHVWMYDEDAISKHGAVGLKCMFMHKHKRF